MTTKSKRVGSRRFINNDVQQSTTTVGDVSGGKGFAIGPGAKAFVVEIGSIFNLGFLSAFLKKYWAGVAITILIQTAAIISWLAYTDRFVIPVSVLAVGVIFLEATIIASIGLVTKPRLRPYFALALAISTFTWGGLTASEIRRIFYPPRFSPQVFGVAVAQFGQGPDFKNTVQAREASQLVLQQLVKQAQEDPDLAFVEFKPIGLIRTQEQAWADGSRVGADLVIWGQLEESEDQTILSFSVLETPDKVSNPMFARVLPLYEMATTSFFAIRSRQSVEIAKGTTAVSSFIFGLAHFFKWNFVSATEAFEEALKATSVNQVGDFRYLVLYYHGLSLQGLYKLEEANEIFQQASQIHPDDPGPWLARAWGTRSLGRIDEAKDDARIAWGLCSKHIQLKPDNYAAYFDRALADEILENWDAALSDYQTTRDKAPDLYIAYIGIDRILIILHRLPEAAETMQEAIKLAESKNANPAWAYIYLAVVQERQGDAAQARAAFEKAISLAPEVDYMHSEFALFLEGTGKPEDLVAAEKEFGTSIEVTNNKAAAHADLAGFLARHGRLEEAVAEYRIALQYDRQSAGIWTQLAEVLARLNRLDEARQSYGQALESDPGNLYSHVSFGGFLYDQNELEAAIRQWEYARQRDLHNCPLLLNLGQAYELLGDRGQTELLYQDAYATESTQDKECRDEAARRLAAFVK